MQNRNKSFSLCDFPGVRKCLFHLFAGFGYRCDGLSIHVQRHFGVCMACKVPDGSHGHLILQQGRQDGLTDRFQYGLRRCRQRDRPFACFGLGSGTDLDPVLLLNGGFLLRLWICFLDQFVLRFVSGLTFGSISGIEVWDCRLNLMTLDVTKPPFISMLFQSSFLRVPLYPECFRIGNALFKAFPVFFCVNAAKIFPFAVDIDYFDCGITC